MVGKSRYCEICGVREIFREGFFAKFPKDKLRCKTWLRQVGKEDLIHVPIEKLHELRHVCGDHFDWRDFGKTGNKLKKRAYPKLNLSAPPLSEHQLTGFPQYVASRQGADQSHALLHARIPLSTSSTENGAHQSHAPLHARIPLSTSSTENALVPAKRSPSC
ncbi:uncharacterized protein LOC133522948 isoform X2 [Cydia pomonella]|uniref:uncharacterized protein LOC133522948 isoform X2 n=1 Tax=Cydia pomonella TaxID=82600 RepID=UPI002ADD52DE|nr:uncharacterized protein LOC133522948 isoform X2 [Cydia pomonella]